MEQLSRRALVTGAAASALALAGCGNGIGSPGSRTIDARVDTTLDYLYRNYPGTAKLRDDAVGILVMPLMTRAGFLTVGGAYGRGALQIRGSTVDYYSATRASFGPQIGAQQYAHVLFFMTEQALRTFRTSPGWAAGADLVYVANNEGETLSAETTTQMAPVIAVVFGQAGLMVGATLEGTKYTRIIP
ncbi:lipid-binding SYLF domain-containing protein [Roseitranquillus sediminis]|uniref:lipid-binding SYLF domain-containing protein n=1 Tax=Roseitranquillus sediminis TaxID=2809051 RepID=UPI001D0C195E|nr:lipid-binding SYLF domain-containing protein [Roseitranquillus sediminis]MBM9595564.1 lipid-binding SYLF domain-containing protein [Roseitranquillus sediminis]